MFAIVSPCEVSNVLRVIYFIKELLKVAFIIIPMGLIVMLTIDFAKSVISNEDEMEKNKKLAIRRVIMCVILFFIPLITKAAFNILHDSEIVVDYTTCIAKANEIAISRFEEQENVFKELENNNMVAPSDPESTRVIISKEESNSEESGNNRGTDSSTSTSTSDANAKELINALDKMSEAARKGNRTGKNWRYTNSGTSGSFAKALKNQNKKTNCAKYISWGLIQVGILKEGQYFYKCYGGRHCSGNAIIYSSDNAKEKMQKNLKYINGKGERAGNLIEDKKLKKGDIVLWQNEQHTNVYAGNNKWYDAGRWAANGASGDLKFKTFGPVKIPSLNHWKVWKILRIKE